MDIKRIWRITLLLVLCCACVSFAAELKDSEYYVTEGGITWMIPPAALINLGNPPYVSAGISAGYPHKPGSDPEYPDLEDITIPETIEGYPVLSYFGDSEYEGGYRVENVRLPEGLDSIQGWAFEDVVIENLYLPSTLEKIDDYAFIQTTVLNIIIPDNNKYFVLKDGDLVSRTDGSLIIRGNTHVTEDGIAWMVKTETAPDGSRLQYASVGISPKYPKKPGSNPNCPDIVDITIPAEIEGYPVLEFFGSKEYAEEHRVENVRLPEGLKRICDGAFLYDITKNLYLPSTLEEIEEQSFDSSYIERIEISDENEHYVLIDGDLFSRVDGTIIIQGNSHVTENGLCWEIKTEALADGTELKYASVWLAASSILLKPDTAYPMMDFFDIVVPTIIENYPVLEYQGDGNKIGLYNIDNVKLPEGLKRICSGAFVRDEIGTLYLPSTLEEIEKDAFVNTEVLSVVIPENNEHYAMYGDSLVCKSDGKLIIQGHRKAGVSEYFIPEGVKIIGSNSLSSYGLGTDSSIIIPETLEYIEAGAFSEFEVIKLIFPGNSFEYDPNAFTNEYGDVVIYRIEFRRPPEPEFAFDLVSNLTNMMYGPVCVQIMSDDYDSPLVFDKVGSELDGFHDFLNLVYEGKYDEALAIQNLDGKHPSDPSGEQPSDSGNSDPSAGPQAPTSPNTGKNSGQLANDPSTPGTQADPGASPASSGNSGSLEPPEEPAVSQYPIPVIAAALFIAMIGAAVLIRKHK